ncbi:hypothetical protein BX600DRAFT_436205 [Xylariales sp. PMI_506]|nr:hypothetical protein BX600DRAFT_436205 [Xylariales sp. PMI_506]
MHPPASIPRPSEPREIAKRSIFGRLGRRLYRKRKDNSNNAPDYSGRWPTTVTLVEKRSDSHFFHDSEGEHHLRGHRKLAKLRILEVASVSLDWLGGILGAMQDHLDHKIELVEARAEKRVNGFGQDLGKSTNPYDVAVKDHCERDVEGFSTGEAPKVSQRTDTSSACSNPQNRAVRVFSRASKTIKQPSARPSPSQGDNIERNSDQANNFTDRPSSKPWGFFEPITPAPTNFQEKRIKPSHKHAWWRFERHTSFAKWNNCEEVRFSGRMSGDGNNVFHDWEVQDVTEIPRPRNQWRSVKGRRASAYPGKVTTAAPLRINVYDASGNITRIENHCQMNSRGRTASSEHLLRINLPSDRGFNKALGVERNGRSCCNIACRRTSSKHGHYRRCEPRSPVVRHKGGPLRAYVTEARSSTPTYRSCSRQSSNTRELDGSIVPSTSCSPANQDSTRLWSCTDSTLKPGAIKYLRNLVKSLPPSRVVTPRAVDEEAEEQNSARHDGLHSQLPKQICNLEVISSESGSSIKDGIARNDSDAIDVGIAPAGHTPDQRRESWLMLMFGNATRSRATLAKNTNSPSTT